MAFPENPFDPQSGATPAITVSQGQNVNPGGQEGTTPAPAPATLPSAPSSPYGSQGTSVSAADLPAAAPAPAPSIPSLPAVPGQPGQAPAIPTPPAAGLPLQTPPAATPPAQPAQSWNTAREFAAAHGFHEAGQFQNDGDFLQAVLRQVAAGGQASQQLQALQAQLAMRAAAPAPPAPAPAVDPNAPRKFFEAPEFNPQWQQWIERTANGGYKLADGCPDPTILPKYLAYQSHRQQMADRLLTDPASTLEPWAKHLVENTIKPLLEQTMAGQQDKQYADQFIRDNSDWLFARNQQGQVMQDQTGRPMASPLAARFYHHVTVAERMGIRSLTDQSAFARQAVQNELYMARSSQGATNQNIPAAAPTQAPTLNWHFGAPQPMAAPASFTPSVNSALRLPANPTGSMAGVGVPGAPPQNANVSLGEMLALALTQAGLVPRS